MKDSNYISKIVEKYSTEKGLVIGTDFQDRSLELLFARLERAALSEAGDESFSRYADWINTVRDTIIEAIKMINENPRDKKIKILLIKAANSLSAFSEIQES